MINGVNEYVFTVAGVDYPGVTGYYGEWLGDYAGAEQECEILQIGPILVCVKKSCLLDGVQAGQPTWQTDLRDWMAVGFMTADDGKTLTTMPGKLWVHTKNRLRFDWLVPQELAQYYNASVYSVYYTRFSSTL